MIEIKFPNSSKEIANRWKDTLDELVVVHKLTSEDSLLKPVLTFSSDRAEGEQKIDEYLNHLRKFVFEWRDCRCD